MSHNENKSVQLELGTEKTLGVSQTAYLQGTYYI